MTSEQLAKLSQAALLATARNESVRTPIRYSAFLLLEDSAYVVRLHPELEPFALASLPSDDLLDMARNEDTTYATRRSAFNLLNDHENLIRQYPELKPLAV
jgi:hypothetical protein